MRNAPRAGGRPALRPLAVAFHSLVALLTGVATLPAVNLAGSALATAAGMAAGGGPRLAWDLAWLVLSLAAGAGLSAWMAPRAPRWHALGLLAGFQALAIAGVVRMGEDWPLWFRAAVVLAPAVLVVAAAWPWRRRVR